MKKILMLALLVTIAGSYGCKSKDANLTTSPENTVPAENAAKDAQKGEENMEAIKIEEPKTVTIDVNKKYHAVIRTSKGDITAELHAQDAPLSVTNFKYLADKSFYNGQTFHRYVPGFVIQGGDPTGTGAGGPGYTLPAEIGKKHLRGALAWARQGDEVNPERRSSGSQFYITLEETPFLDGGYTVFGQVTDGMSVVESLRADDVITSVEVHQQ
jgi:cyclophilin family peptidyl-prolyl cis-trans isomerase